jgi:hypothetical protein
VKLLQLCEAEQITFSKAKGCRRSIRFLIVAVLTEIQNIEIILPFNPLGMAVAEIHAGAFRTMIVFLVRPVVMSAAQATTPGIIRVQHQQDFSWADPSAQGG